MTFIELVRKSHWYFKEIKMPPDDTMDIWTEEAGGYPNEFYSWAFEHIKTTDSGKTVVLGNFPKFINGLWQNWMRANPHKIDRKESTCPHCTNGWILFYRREPFYHNEWHSVAARCGHCNTLPQTIECATYRNQDIQKNGWLLMTAENMRMVNAGEI
jgi:hypothetical protein